MKGHTSPPLLQHTSNVEDATEVKSNTSLVSLMEGKISPLVSILKRSRRGEQWHQWLDES